MPKFARPTSYNGRGGNQLFTGDVRFATQDEVLLAESKQLAISPATLAGAIGTVIPPASTTEAGIVQLATNAQAIAGSSSNLAIVPSSLAAVLASPPAIGGTLAAAGTFTSITTTTGNIISAGAGSGLIFNASTVSGATSATLNARVGQITITSPSIAAGAAFTFTLTNNVIIGSTTQVGYWLSGGTLGSALAIQSYANTASQSIITLHNGTGATANTATLILNFLVLN